MSRTGQGVHRKKTWGALLGREGGPLHPDQEDTRQARLRSEGPEAGGLCVEGSAGQRGHQACVQGSVLPASDWPTPLAPGLAPHQRPCFPELTPPSPPWSRPLPALKLQGG